MTEKLRNCSFYGAIIANKIKRMNKIGSNKIFLLMTHVFGLRRLVIPLLIQCKLLKIYFKNETFHSYFMI